MALLVCRKLPANGRKLYSVRTYHFFESSISKTRRGLSGEKKRRLEAFKRFASSYQAFRAGVDHDLIVIFKGFEGRSDLERARQVFQEVFQEIPLFPSNSR